MHISVDSPRHYVYLPLADTSYAEADEMKNDFETGTSASAVP